jgi:hypothetical protein
MVAADLNKTNIAVDIHVAQAGDLDAVVALDAATSGTAKASYWQDIHSRYTKEDARTRRYFLVGKSPDDELLGFIVGEIRAWEFGSPPRHEASRRLVCRDEERRRDDHPHDGTGQ